MANKEANTLGQELEQQLFSGINAAQKAPLPLKHKPWRFSTGPTTAAGKARMAANHPAVCHRLGEGADHVPQTRGSTKVRSKCMK